MITFQNRFKLIKRNGMKDYLSMFILHGLQIFDSLVWLLTLGFIETSLHLWFLWDVLEDD